MRHFKQAWQHIRRSPYQAVVGILTISLTFYLASIFTLLVIGSQMVISYFETRPQVSAFFKDDYKLSQVEELKKKLEDTGKVESTKYVSKEEALTIYKEQNKDDPSLLEMVTANILPASLEVSAKNINYLSDIAAILKTEPGIEEVVYQEDMVAKMQVWIVNLRRTGLELVGSLGTISFFIVFIIIGLKVISRKDEIEILQLIGASRWYIQLPFLLEGIFYGVLGAIIGWGIAYVRLLYLAPQLSGFLKDLPIPPIPTVVNMLTLLGLEVLLGVLIGILGSLVALRRYLK